LNTVQARKIFLWNDLFVLLWRFLLFSMGSEFWYVIIQVIHLLPPVAKWPLKIEKKLWNLQIWFVEKFTFGRCNLFQTIFFLEQIFIKNCLKKISCLDFSIRMWLMAYKINICKPFRKMFDSFWIKTDLLRRIFSVLRIEL
jgi:hypothetical protein